MDNYNKGEHINVYESQPLYNKGLRVFKDCQLCSNGEKCLHRKAPIGPTSGIIGIQYASDTHPDAKIDVFGMNWKWPGYKSNNNKKKHPYHLQNEKEIIDNCCKKCIIHNTPTLSYR